MLNTFKNVKYSTKLDTVTLDAHPMITAIGKIINKDYFCFLKQIVVFSSKLELFNILM